MDVTRQRIDKWLWHARVVRTRSAAAALVAANHVRLNGDRIDAPSRAVRPGDVLTVALDDHVRVLRVAGFAERRGNSDLAVSLYDDLTLPEPATERELPSGVREPGTGRPTKRDRRAWARLTDRGHQGGER